MLARKTLRTRLVKLLYRVTAPKHPRGWIEVDWEEQANGKLRLFTEGLEKFDLPDLELLDCPADQVLLGYCHGMFFVAVGALAASREAGRPIRSGDIVDLRSSEEEFPIRVRITQSTEVMFRLEDILPGQNGFPSAATANYITNAAETMRNPLAAKTAVELASSIHATDFDFATRTPSEDALEDALEQCNARPFYVLGDALFALGETEASFAALDEGVARAPFMAERIKRETEGPVPPGTPLDHLTSVDPWALQARFRAERVAGGIG